MKKAEFLAMVQNELDTIKAKATKKELKKLNFKTFDHTSTFKCIYGQMTGECDSDRAKELYPKIYGWGINRAYEPFSSQSFAKGDYFTPLEKYLCMVKEPQHKKLIQYLKGEIETIKL